MVLATAAVVKVPIPLTAPLKFKVCNKLPPLISIVPVPLNTPPILKALVLVPPKAKVPAIEAKPEIATVVGTVPKLNVPASRSKLFIVLFPCKVFVPLPEIVKFL